METSLHQQLKRHYAADPSQTEVTVGRFRIDAVRDDELIEIQCASLSAIKSKCQSLLMRHALRVVKPVIERTRIVKLAKVDGEVTSRRLSPKRGSVLDVFDELIYFTRVFPHANLIVEVPMIHVEQHRVPSKPKRRRRWQKDYRVVDVTLTSIERTIELRTPADLLGLLDLPTDIDSFNTTQLASEMKLPIWQAQKIAYVLRKVGAIEQTARKKSGIVYARAG